MRGATRNHSKLLLQGLHLNFIVNVGNCIFLLFCMYRYSQLAQDTITRIENKTELFYFVSLLLCSVLINILMMNVLQKLPLRSFAVILDKIFEMSALYFVIYTRSKHIWFMLCYDWYNGWYKYCDGKRCFFHILVFSKSLWRP